MTRKSKIIQINDSIATCVNSAEKPELAAGDFFSRTVDGHLVMNVLNQLAAQSYLQSGKECTQIFALSEYLSEALRQIGDRYNTLRQDAHLLRLHLQLLATLHRFELELKIMMETNDAHKIQKGSLYALSQCFFQSATPAYGGKWKMHVTLCNDINSPHTLRTIIEMQGVSHGQNLGLTSACHHVCNAVTRKLVNVVCEAKVTQDTIDHLRLIACIPVQVNTSSSPL
jgi:hypothetical protein